MTLWWTSVLLKDSQLIYAALKNSVVRDNSRNWNLDVVLSWKNHGISKAKYASIFGRNRGKKGQNLYWACYRGVCMMYSVQNSTHSYNAVSNWVAMNVSWEALKHGVCLLIYVYADERTYDTFCLLRLALYLSHKTEWNWSLKLHSRLWLGGSVAVFHQNCAVLRRQ